MAFMGNQHQKILRLIINIGNMWSKNLTLMDWALSGQMLEMSWTWELFMEGKFYRNYLKEYTKWYICLWIDHQHLINLNYFLVSSNSWPIKCVLCTKRQSKWYICYWIDQQLKKFKLFVRFAAAMREHNVWVMNVVNVDSPDTLPIIYERGLFGIYHDWCESFSTYPRTYDLLHADHLFFKLKTR